MKREREERVIEDKMRRTAQHSTEVLTFSLRLRERGGVDCRNARAKEKEKGRSEDE